MSINRSALRDVFIWDLEDNEDRIPLGGLVLSNGITNQDFHEMLRIILITSSDCILQDDYGGLLPEDDQALRPGNYYISANKIEVNFICSILFSLINILKVNNEMVYQRGASITTGPRVEAFKDAVRARDGGCVVSKERNFRAAAGMWGGFEAAHIFPLAYEQQWKEEDYNRWITIDPPQGGKINSVQNGLCLREDLHTMFGHYYFSINPDVSLPDYHHILLITIHFRMDTRSSSSLGIGVASLEKHWMLAYSTTHSVR